MQKGRHHLWGVPGVLALSVGLAWAQSDLQITNMTRVAPGHIRIDASAPTGERCILRSAGALQQAFTNVADSGREAAADGSVAWTVTKGTAPQAFYRVQRAADRELITWSMLEAGLAGTFGTPMAEEGDYRFGYSSGVHVQLTNGNLLVVGHPYYDRQAQVRLPAVLDGREGTRVGNWTDTHHGIVFFVYRGLGQTWYGENSASPGLPDPYVSGSGFHAEGWALQVWIYDPDDVMAVYRGERNPWSLAPTEAVLLTERLPGASNETYYSFFTGKARTDLKVSFRNNRLVILQEDGHPANEWENTPKGYAINLP